MQVQEAIYNGSAVVNPGYYDVPICNEYSNKELPRIIRKVNEFDVNKKIHLTLNNNNEEYIVHEYPTRPSASLYYETDEPLSRYYNKNYEYRYYNAIEQFENEINNNYQHSFIIIFVIILILLSLFFIK